MENNILQVLQKNKNSKNRFPFHILEKIKWRIDDAKTKTETKKNFLSFFTTLYLFNFDLLLTKVFSLFPVSYRFLSHINDFIVVLRRVHCNVNVDRARPKEGMKRYESGMRFDSWDIQKGIEIGSNWKSTNLNKILLIKIQEIFTFYYHFSCSVSWYYTFAVYS